MPSRTSGNAGEGAVLHALALRGYWVSVPFGDGQPYDLVVDVPAEGLARVQVKTAWERRGCLVFNTLATDHGNGRMPYVGLADIFGVYFPPLDSVYLVSLDEVAATEGRLRLEPTRNNQKRRIRLAAEYEIDTWTRERLIGVFRRSRGTPRRLAA